MLCNEHWKSKNPHYQLDYMPSLTSDHTPGILTIQNNLNLGPKPFKFMKGWLRHPRFKPILRDSWEEYEVGNPLVRLAKKLKRLKVPLKALNKEEYGDINKRVEKARQNLENVQKQLMDDPFNRQLQVETQNARETYSNFLTFEEAFFKEKARIKWMKEGDKNTQFFHRTVRMYNARNKILRLQNEDGNTIEDYNQVQQTAINFFQNLFTEPSPPNDNLLQNWTRKSLSPEQASTLSTQVTPTEIKEAFISLSSESAPGPDGYTAHFFKKTGR